MTLPLISPPSPSVNEPAIPAWSGPYGRPYPNARLPVRPDPACTFSPDVYSVTTVSWQITFIHGDLSEFTSVQ